LTGGPKIRIAGFCFPEIPSVGPGRFGNRRFRLRQGYDETSPDFKSAFLRPAGLDYGTE
jgi:hypothetical protein